MTKYLNVHDIVLIALVAIIVRLLFSPIVQKIEKATGTGG
jgi:hypothetical protein